MGNWALSDIPDLTGRTAVVTGGNAGLGFASARELARSGAEVTIACRRPDAADEAIGRIRRELPDAALSGLRLDLADPGSIDACAASFRDRNDRLDVLLNNAAAISLKSLRRTAGGHEMHMATNHYGTFALTGRLFGLLCRTPGARVVAVSSGAARWGEIRLDDMDWRKRPYVRRKAYADSKLANLLFMHALQSRFDAAGADALSVAAHPGLAATERQLGPGKSWLSGWLAAPVGAGVAPQLRAATDPGVRGRDFYGPRFGIRGPAWKLPVKPPVDVVLAERLWSFTEERTGVSYGVRDA